MKTWIEYIIIAVILIIISLVIVKLSKRDFKAEANKLITYLGGKDNIIEHFVNGSRLSLILKNYDLVNIEKLNELGFPSVIKMSNKITLVYEGDLESLAKRIFNE